MGTALAQYKQALLPPFGVPMKNKKLERGNDDDACTHGRTDSYTHTHAYAHTHGLTLEHALGFSPKERGRQEMPLRLFSQGRLPFI